MRLVKTLIMIMLLGISCVQDKKKVDDCDSIIVPQEVIDSEVEDLYKEAQWQLYKINLLNTDSFVIKDKAFRDTISSKKLLSEFEFDLFRMEKIKDTVRFTLFFEQGVSPARNIYYYNATFWGDNDKVELGGRISFVFDKDEYSDKFERYILSNRNNLSLSLECLAVERNVLPSDSEPE